MRSRGNRCTLPGFTPTALARVHGSRLRRAIRLGAPARTRMRTRLEAFSSPGCRNASRCTGKVDQHAQVCLNAELCHEGFVALCCAVPLSDCTIKTHQGGVARKLKRELADAAAGN